jgi:hypothetical protein
MASTSRLYRTLRARCVMLQTEDTLKKYDLVLLDIDTNHLLMNRNYLTMMRLMNVLII